MPHAVPPTMIREAELHQHEKVIPGGWIAAGGPFLLLAACAAYLWTGGAETPALFSGLWHVNDQLIELRGHTLPIYLITVFAILTSMSLVLYWLEHWVRPVHAGGREAARELKFRAPYRLGDPVADLDGAADPDSGRSNAVFSKVWVRDRGRDIHLSKSMGFTGDE